MKLYKFIRPERISDLEQGTIRFSQVAAFNDPFEEKPFIFVPTSSKAGNVDAVLPEMLKLVGELGLVDLGSVVALEGLRVIFEKLLPPALTDPHAQSLRLANWLEDRVGIFVLCEVCDHPLMWAHYAADHTGVVIEFESGHSFFQPLRAGDSPFGSLRQIDYRSKRPSRSISTISRADLFSVKSLDWSYEREWRMLMPLSKGKKVPEFDEHGSPVYLDKHNKVAKHRESPMGVPVHVFKFPPDAVSAVILGCRASKTLETRVSLLQKGPEYKHLAVRKAILDDDAFRIKIT